MIIFPKSINESVWRKHLAKYSQILPHHFSEQMFDLFLTQPKLSPQNVYFCPLCTNSYFYLVNNEVFGNSEFSEDHLPPESVGGKYKVLTCKKCNNDFGTYEAELNSLVDFGNVSNKRNNSIFPKTFIVDEETGDRFKGYVNFIGGKTNISFIEQAKQYNKNLKQFLAKLHSGNISSLKLVISSPDLNKIAIALLKSAYLACFVWWGYDFVFSDNAKLIRSVLKNEVAYPTRIPTVWKEKEVLNLPIGMSILSKNGIKKSFMFVLELKGKTEVFNAVVLIPGPTKSCWLELKELDKSVRAKDLTEFECITIPKTVVNKGYTIGWDIINV